MSLAVFYTCMRPHVTNLQICWLQRLPFVMSVVRFVAAMLEGVNTPAPVPTLPSPLSSCNLHTGTQSARGSKFALSESKLSLLPHPYLISDSSPHRLSCILDRNLPFSSKSLITSPWLSSHRPPWATPQACLSEAVTTSLFLLLLPDLCQGRGF